MQELIDSILRLPSVPFSVITLGGGLSLYFCIILDLLKNQQEDPSIDWSCFLHEIILGLQPDICTASAS